MNVSPITDWTRNEPDASISRMAFLKDKIPTALFLS